MSVVPFQSVHNKKKNKRRILQKDDILTYGPCIIKINKKGLRACDFPPETNLETIIDRVVHYMKSGHIAVLDAEKTADGQFTRGQISHHDYKFMTHFFSGAPMVQQRIKEIVKSEKCHLRCTSGNSPGQGR